MDAIFRLYKDCNYFCKLHLCVLYCSVYYQQSTHQNEIASNHGTEGWNNAFQCLMGCNNPTIWRFIDVSKKEQDLPVWKSAVSNFLACRTTVQIAHCSSTESNFRVC